VVRLERIVPGVALACLVGVLLVYGAHAGALTRYPWDWSPDEGLFLDYARRLLHDPASLYPRQVVPYPAIYGPLIAVALAPFAAWSDQPLPLARAFNVACILAASGAIFALVKRCSGWLVGVAAVALWLAPLDVSFWHMLVRPDTPMLAALLLAAWQLMPDRLARGADRLGARRLLSGSALLLAAALFKPTALLHAAPLLAAWFLVDGPSARRLALSVGAAVLASASLLELLSGGGYSWSQRLFAAHPYFSEQVLVILQLFFARTWPVLLLTALAFGAAWREGRTPWRDGSVGLIAGGLLVLPALAKGGAYFNYLLPLLSALVIAAGRWLGRASPSAALLAGATAFTLAATTTFPLPSARNEATAAFFYGFVRDASRAAPILAIAPDYAYWVAAQPVELEATGLLFLSMGAPGAELIVERLVTGRYGLVIEGPWRLPDTAGSRAILGAYAPVGECRLGSFLGPLAYRLNLRRGSKLRFLPPQGTDCRPALAPS
jgi:hypothetical protein